jgi:hypothetical protein
MARFETKIRKARFQYAGYSPQQMTQIGSDLIQQGLIPRILHGGDVYDQPAPPLSEKYRRRKLLAGKSPIRDWSLSGRTLRSLKVLVAGPNKAILGFTDAVSNLRAVINNRRHRQFGVSPANQTLLLRLFQRLPNAVQAKKVA